jgi:Ice-binding-like/Bacterial Ig-like domain (group 3)
MTHGETHPKTTGRTSHRGTKSAIIIVLTAALVGVGLIAGSAPAGAAAYENSVGLGVADSYTVLASQTVTNTGPSDLPGDLGVNPLTAVTGFPPGLVHGVTRTGNAAATAQASLTAAYLDAAGRAPTGSALGGSLAGGTFVPGVYNATSSLGVSGAVTLDGQGDPNAVFIFQIGDALTTASSTAFVLTGAAQACNVFWQVGSSATLGTTNTFVGTVMALTSITVNTGTTVAGRALARNGAVTLDDNVFSDPTCHTTPTTTTVTTTPATTGKTTTLTATVAASGANAPTGTVTFSSNGVALGTATIGANGVATLTVPAGTTVGTRSITAHFNGVAGYGVSTSAATNLRVTATPVIQSATPVLAATGPTEAATLSLLGVVLLLAGLTLTTAARARRITAYQRRQAVLRAQ